MATIANHCGHSMADLAERGPRGIERALPSDPIGVKDKICRNSGEFDVRL